MPVNDTKHWLEAEREERESELYSGRATVINDTELVKEIARESAIVSSHKTYLTIQITISTWQKLQARILEINK